MRRALGLVSLSLSTLTSACALTEESGSGGPEGLLALSADAPDSEPEALGEAEVY